MVEISVLIGEIIVWAILDIENRKFRWDYHYKPTWKIALTFLLLIIIIIPLLDTFLWNIGINFLINNFKSYLISVLIILFCLIYLWATKIIIGIKINKYDFIPLLIIILTAVLTYILKRIL